MDILSKQGADVIAKLTKYPHLQIKYLDSLLEEEKQKPSNRVSTQSKLLYVRLMTQHFPDSLCNALETFNFPLDDCLKICKESNNLFGCAYIRFRLGMKDDAISSYRTVSFD
jgi:hypothetical protein